MMTNVAAYGTLMTGQMNLLPRAVRQRMVSLSPCIIPGRLFRVHNPTTFDYPALVPAPGQAVRGELFTIPLADLKAFDAYEEFDPAQPEASTYLRRRQVVDTASGPVRAWVYVWNRPTAGLQPRPGNAWA